MGYKDGPEVVMCVYKELFGTETEYCDPDTISYARDASVQELGTSEWLSPEPIGDACSSRCLDAQHPWMRARFMESQGTIE